jgi:hypothetical protein
MRGILDGSHRHPGRRLTELDTLPARRKKTLGVSPAGRGPLSHLPGPGANSSSRLIGGAVNRKARSRSGRASQHGLRGVTFGNACTGSCSPWEPYTRLTGLLDTRTLCQPNRGSPYPQASLRVLFAAITPPTTRVPQDQIRCRYTMQSPVRNPE